MFLNKVWEEPVGLPGAKTAGSVILYSLGQKQRPTYQPYPLQNTFQIQFVEFQSVSPHRRLTFLHRFHFSQAISFTVSYASPNRG